jgi:type I restriction enzyme S subunit
VRCDTAKVLPEYLAEYSSSQRGKSFFVRSSKQSTNLASINSTQLKAFPLALANVPEQRQIILRLEDAAGRIASEELGLRKLLLLKSGLMDDLLTGRVRVTPLLAGAAQRESGD